MGIIKKEKYINLINQINSDLYELERKLFTIEQKEIDLNLIDENNYVESLNEIVKEIRGSEYDEIVNKTYNLLEELFKIYLDVSSQQRKIIETIFQDKKLILDVVVSFPKYVCDFISSPSDTIWFQLGLVSALMIDGKVDFRDVFISLGDLHKKSLESGINTKRYFIKIESLSAKRGRKSILNKFLNSDFLKSGI